MSLVCGYGICLKELQENQIELIRNWRNNEDVKRFMFFQDYITIEMQQKWFNEMFQRKDLYFIINYDEQEIGVINLLHIDEKKMEAEAGVFIAEKSYRGTDIAVRASVLFLEFVFEMFPEMKIVAKSRKDNLKLVNYNLQLGFVQTDTQRDVVFFSLQKPDFLNKTMSIRMLISKLYGDCKTIELKDSSTSLASFFISNKMENFSGSDFVFKS